MDYVYDNWIGLGGLVVTGFGLAFTVWQVYLARKAAEESKDAASAAHTASVETRSAIHGVLTVADLERAIGYIRELKEFHRDRRWDVCLNMYQIVRASLEHIRKRLPVREANRRQKLLEAINQMMVMENSVDNALMHNIDPTTPEKFNSTLNEIQVSLEEIVSSVQTREGEVST